MRHRTFLAVSLLIAIFCCAAHARLDIKRYGELREAERYQIDVAEKLYRDRKYDSALAEYEKFINLYLKSVGAPYAQYMIAKCQQHRNHLNQAIKEYKALIDYFPKSPEAPMAAFDIGYCHALGGEPELAVQHYLAVLKNYPDHSAAGDALWEASEIQLSRGLNDKAVDLRKKLVQAYPKCSRFGRAVNWLVDHYLLQQDDLTGARAVFRLYRSEIDTEKHIALRLYNHAYYQFYRHGKQKEAKAWMDKAISVFKGITVQFADNETNALWAMGHQGHAFQYSFRPKEATEAFEAVLKKAPEHDGWRNAYARFLEGEKKWPDARLQFMRFKDKAKGAYEAAESYHREGKYKEAEDAYMGVVTQYADYSKLSLYRLGYMHHTRTHNYEKAINAYRQSEYSPPTYLLHIADCFSRWKKYDMAIKSCREVIGFFPKHAPDATWRIAHYYEGRNQEGDRDRAIGTLKRICDLYPKSSLSSNAHQRLESKYKVHYTGGGLKKREKKE